MSDRNDRNRDDDRKTNQHADQANPEHGTMPPDASIQRNVGARTPERVDEQQVRNAGHEDVNGEANVVPEMAPNQTTGGPAETDRVPIRKKT